MKNSDPVATVHPPSDPGLPPPYSNQPTAVQPVQSQATVHPPSDPGLPPQYSNQPITVQPVQSQAYQTVIISNRSYVDFTGAFILSCFVCWCCGCIFGLIAFIFAVVGQTAASNGGERFARSMLTRSYIYSAVGAVLGVTTIIAFLIVFFVTTKRF